MSTFAAQFAQRLLDNIQARLEANANTQVAAVDSALALFSTELDSHDQAIGFNTPTEIATNFPCLYLEPSSVKLDQAEDDLSIRQQHEMAISLSITGPDANTLKGQIVKYVTALDRCIRQMTPTQLTGGITNAVSGVAWEVTEHRYGVITTDRTIYRRDAQLVLVIQDFER